MKRFSDLISWRLASELAIEVYKVTKSFPKDELFGLTSQIRRAAVSVSSNIAEGFGRESIADKIHFYVIARGSIYEVQSQLKIAKAINLIGATEYTKVMDVSSETLRVLHGLIGSTRGRLTSNF